MGFVHLFPQRGRRLISLTARTTGRRRLALGTILAIVIGSGATGTAYSADGSDNPPPVHGPGARAAAAAEPDTPNGPEVGPPFTKTNNVWQTDTTTPTLRNTVTAPSGHKTTATFEVHTTDSSGKPTATVVKLTDENQWGVLVSGEVTAGKPASVTVPAGKLKNGVTYAVRSSGYDATSNVYESDWSPYSTFKINVPRPRSRTSPSRHHRPRPASTHLRRLRSNSRVPIPARSRDCAAMTTAGNAPPRTPRAEGVHRNQS